MDSSPAMNNVPFTFLGAKNYYLSGNRYSIQVVPLMCSSCTATSTSVHYQGHIRFKDGRKLKGLDGEISGTDDGPYYYELSSSAGSVIAGATDKYLITSSEVIFGKTIVDHFIQWDTMIGDADYSTNIVKNVYSMVGYGYYDKDATGDNIVTLDGSFAGLLWKQQEAGKYLFLGNNYAVDMISKEVKRRSHYRKFTVFGKFAISCTLNTWSERKDVVFKVTDIDKFFDNF